MVENRALSDPAALGVVVDLRVHRSLLARAKGAGEASHHDEPGARRGAGVGQVTLYERRLLADVRGRVVDPEDEKQPEEKQPEANQQQRARSH